MQHHHVGTMLGGVTPTKGGLVFAGDMNGNAYAFDAEIGRKLWQHEFDDAMGGGLISYEAGGHQRVAVISGTNTIVFSLAPNSTGRITVVSEAPPAASGWGKGMELLRSRRRSTDGIGVEVEVRLRSLAVRKRSACYRPNPVMRPSAHTGRSGHVGRFSKADIGSATCARLAGATFGLMRCTRL
jgi:hypothetical protein